MTDLPARLRDAVKGVSKDDGFDYLVPAKDLAQTNALLTEAAERIEGLDEEYERTTDDQQATIDSLRAALDKVEAFAEEMMESDVLRFRGLSLRDLIAKETDHG